jgi:hypothetical protein
MTLESGAEPATSAATAAGVLGRIREAGVQHDVGA